MKDALDIFHEELPNHCGECMYWWIGIRVIRKVIPSSPPFWTSVSTFVPSFWLSIKSPNWGPNDFLEGTWAAHKQLLFFMLEGFSRVYAGSKISPIFNSFSGFFLHLVFLCALLIFRVSTFSSSFLSHLSSLLAIFFSCFFCSFFLSNGFFFKL
jgi:hypothetical protein